MGDAMSKISVVVAVRNEEKNVTKLLDCLTRQSLPFDRFEIIIVDDSSEDRTVEKIDNYNAPEQFALRLVKSSPNNIMGRSPKKVALQRGIDASVGNIIVTTDGDCWFGTNWLASITQPFADEHTSFVAGPVAIHGDESMFAEIQSLEFSSLIGTSGALIQLNYPLMCNGANLAFRKKAFVEVDGYDDHISGDDVFLMQKIHAIARKSVVFQKNPESVVYTAPQPTFAALIQQRKRWASKWNKYMLPLSRILPIILFVHYVSFLAALVASILAPYLIRYIAPMIVIKLILDYIILKKVMDLCKLRLKFGIFFFSELLYPFYALFIGITVHFGKYRWKGRSHNV